MLSARAGRNGCQVLMERDVWDFTKTMNIHGRGNA